jgi:outer membrane receptor protein involved in Fe transport
MVGAALTCVAAPQVALAQDDQAATAGDQVAADEDSASGNTIIVTATKREQTLQDVPVAVSVATAETIERAEIRDIKDLQTEIPSLRVSQNQSSAQTTFTIRGFGNGANNVGIEPSVGVFVDGVYRSRITSRISDLPDIQRVEVLRGPQSTLFGKNASVGVISIVTREPQFDFGGSAELSYGNFDQIVGKALVTGPVSENVAVSLAGGLNFRDGYIRDEGSGTDLNERNRWFARGQVLIEPSADFKFRLIADYDKLDESCCGVVLLKAAPATQVIYLLGGQQSDPNDPFADVVYNNFDAENKLENYGISGQFDWSFGDATLTSISSWRKSNALTRQDVDFSTADLLYPFLTDIRTETFTQEFRLAAEFGDRINVLLGAFYLNDKINQTGGLSYGADMRNFVNIQVQAATGGALSLGVLEQTFGALDGDPTQYAGTFFADGAGLVEDYSLDNESFSVFGQVDFEITDRLTLTLGGNYTKDKKDFGLDADSSDVFSSINLDAPQYAPFRYQLLYQGALAQGVGQALGLGRPATGAEIGGFAGSNPGVYATINAGAQAYGLGNANNPAANPLGIARALQFIPPFLDVPNAVEDGKTRDDDFSYTIRLAYDVSDSINVYATYATGFKASSINLSRDSRPFAADAAALGAAGLLQTNQAFGSRFAGPEDSTVYEAGLKGNWGGISANFAVFKQEVKGFQSNIFTGTGFLLANAGKQSTFGVEFEGQAEVTDAFGLNLGVTYLDPKYDDFEFSSVGDLTGTTPAGIPKWSVTVGGQYDYELGNGDNIVARASYHYESDVKVVEGLSAYLSQGAAAAQAAADPYHRQVDELSASLAYEMDNGLSLSIWGRNLLDDRYLQTIFDTPAQTLTISGYPNQPRTYGATARFKF